MTEKQTEKQKKLRRVGLIIMLVSALLLAVGFVLLKMPKAILPHLTGGVAIERAYAMRTYYGDDPAIEKGLVAFDIPAEDTSEILRLLENTTMRHKGMLARGTGEPEWPIDAVRYQVYLIPTQAAIDAGAKTDVKLTCGTDGLASFEYAYYQMQNGEELLAKLASYEIAPQPPENP